MANQEVNKQGELADQLYARMYQTPDASGNPAPNAAPAPAPAVAAPAPTDATQVPTQSTTQQPAAPAAPSPKEETAEYWKNRFNVIDGKYRAEVPALFTETRKLRAELDAANTRISQSQTAAPAAQTAQLIKPEEVQEYGEGLTDFIKRAAKEAMGQQPTDLAQRQDNLEKQVRAGREQAYYSDLKRFAPDWEVINQNPEFLGWLSQIDQMTGMQRQILLERANAELDAPRTALFFNTWKAANPQAQPPASAAPQVNPLEEMLAPSTTGGAAPDTGGKKIWTQPEIGKFYSDWRGGKYKAADAERIEQDIIAANNEGRIRR